jgi:hypothetical protein
MRPKIVILILGIAAGLVAALVLLQGVIGGRSGNVPPVAAVDKPTNQEPPAVTNVQANPDSSNTPAMTPEEARAAQIQGDLDEIREALANGTEDPGATEDILLGKVTSPEKEVRKAALEALMQMNDTNAIPRLQQAVKSIEDPRDKVAVLDAIAYLQLPDTSMATPPETNIVNQPKPQRKPKAPGQTGSKKHLLRDPNQNQQEGSSPSAGPRPRVPIQANPNQPQPATPAPDNSPPQ